MTALDVIPTRREVLDDSRGASLRATWHSRERLLVMSLWRDDGCRGTVQLAPAEVARLGGFLFDVLAEQVGNAEVTRTPRPSLLRRLRAFVRPERR
ncbi:MAG: hypothetical protein M5U14_13360 [Acidimicrobiia bacterium]|nr:hypothetical protein [Acidimicrobiia bacterium]